jgi:hypothetical protein
MADSGLLIYQYDTNKSGRLVASFASPSTVTFALNAASVLPVGADISGLRPRV